MKKFICGICGIELTTYRGKFRKHIEDIHKLKFEDYLREYHSELGGYCKTCGKPTNFVNCNEGFLQYCSTKCSNGSNEVKKKKKQTTLEHYGVEHPAQSKEIQEKMKQSNLEKYGVENALQSPEIQERIKQTNLEKYSVEYPSQSKYIRDKSKKTCMEHHGVEYPSQSKYVRYKSKQTWLEHYGVLNPSQSVEIKEKKKQTTLEHYGVENPYQSPEIKEKIKQINFWKYGVEFASQSKEIQEKQKQTSISYWFSKHIKVCKRLDIEILETPEEWYHKEWDLGENKHRFYCNIHNIDFESEFYNDRNMCPECKKALQSRGEREVGDFIESFGIAIIRNDRTQIKPKEIDIWIPSMNLGIEYNGTYWHQDKYRDEEKISLCESKGIKLYTIWDYQWEDRREETEEYLRRILNL